LKEKNETSHRHTQELVLFAYSGHWYFPALVEDFLTRIFQAIPNKG
jgi:hypothetical protein